MDLTDLFVFATMLVLAPIFLVILCIAMLVLAPIWVPIELAHWWGRRHA